MEVLTAFLAPFFGFFFARHGISLPPMLTPHGGTDSIPYKSLADGAYLDKEAGQLIECRIESRFVACSSPRPRSVAV